ncbi:ribonuclease 1-like isoform X1 [Cucurbita moschata]|uniref:Ribonuclease 1-like isoform X1 n=1 Tax=Cucurbita moschata TaxID=3662 RepID=A0A6J1FZQ4_CUCMO|nr:ribonuclease 1-like isoform X1 [Cucurbita moschata]
MSEVHILPHYKYGWVAAMFITPSPSPSFSTSSAMAFISSNLLPICISLLLFFNSVYSFDYFQMVLQWPPATCKTKDVVCYTAPPKMFTIHGLWPSYFSGDMVVCTSKPKLDPTKQLAPLKTQLEMYWPDVISGDHETFWKHEWDKHGKCSLFTQYQYFEVSLRIRLNSTFNIISHLECRPS